MDPIRIGIIGIIGGSGLYRMAALEQARERVLDTPFGAPLDAVLVGKLGGVDVAFLARHGRSHSLIPSQVPYRANVYAMKALGVQYPVSVSAVGSLREEIAPLDMVLPDQFIDLTRQRARSFFGDGVVPHVAIADPVCAALGQVLAHAHADAGLSEVRLHTRGSYVCIEGPAFSTRAESQSYRGLGASVIGMTNMSEARLAPRGRDCLCDVGPGHRLELLAPPAGLPCNERPARNDYISDHIA